MPAPELRSPEESAYPQDTFPENRYRRVLGVLPAPHSPDFLDRINAERAELWKDEPVDPAPYPTSRSFQEVKGLLDADASAFKGARTQYSTENWVGPTDGPNYDELDIAGALGWLTEQGYAQRDEVGNFLMTRLGLEALQA